jgi:hypothetical protein
VPWPVGFESECWIADERWFIKVWNDREHPVDLSLLDALADAALPVSRSLVCSATSTTSPPSTSSCPRPLLTDEPFDQLRPRLSHPWIADRAEELVAWLDRFESVLARGRATTVPIVLSHDDLDGANVLIGDDGTVVAALDWDWARLGPREHDLWTVIDHQQPRRFLDAYAINNVDLDPTHLELGLLRRALGDLAARVIEDVDRPGVGTWGFERLARVDDTLALF